MRRIAISLTKGGVGKSTTAVNLAHGLARMGRKVLLVDADTQGQVSAMLGVQTAKNLADVVLDGVAPMDAAHEARGDLFLLAGGEKLAKLAQEIARDDIAPQQKLTEALEPVDSQFDYVLVDTAPGWDQLAINVLFFAEEILSPVSLEALTIQSLGSYRKRLKRIQKYRDALELRYVLPTFLDGRVAKSAEVLDQLKQHLPARMLCEPIRYNARLAEAPAHGETIFEYAPRSRGAEDYQTLTDHVLDDE